MRLSDLLDQRARLAADMRGINDSATEGALDAAQQGRFDELRAQLDALETRIQRQATIDDLERRMRGAPMDDGRRDLQRTKQEFSLCRLIASAFDGTVDAGREREICQEQRTLTGRAGDGYLVPFDCMAPAPLERRTLTYAGDGANLVSTNVLPNQFIDALRPASVTARLGVQVLTGLVGNIALPRRDARTPHAAWFAEGGSINAGGQSFDQVEGEPHHLGVITAYSRRMMLQATPGIEQLTRQHLIAEIGAALDLAVLTGDGGSAEPEGILAVEAINTHATTGGSSTPPAWLDVATVLTKPIGDDVPEASPGWVFAASELLKFLTTTKLADEDGSAGFLAEVGAGTLGGKPYLVSSHMPTNVALYGYWTQVLAAFWSGVEILVNPYESTAYSKGHVSVRGLVDADVLIRHPEGFVLWDPVTTAPGS